MCCVESELRWVQERAQCVPCARVFCIYIPYFFQGIPKHSAKSIQIMCTLGKNVQPVKELVTRFSFLHQVCSSTSIRLWINDIHTALECHLQQGQRDEHPYWPFALAYLWFI